MTVMPCGSRKNTSAASQSQTVMGPLAAITGTRLRLAMATTERKTRSQGPSARLSCGLASVVEGPAFIVDRAWRRRPPPVCEINGKDSGGGGGPSNARAAVSGCGRHLYGPVQFTRTAAGAGLPLLSQVLQARALHGEAIEHGQLFAARAAGHPTPMDLFGPVLGLPIGFEIGSEKAERMQRGGRAVTIRSYAVLSIVALYFVRRSTATRRHRPRLGQRSAGRSRRRADRSEEHTSELQSLRHLVCRLLLEK